MESVELLFATPSLTNLLRAQSSPATAGKRGDSPIVVLVVALLRLRLARRVQVDQRNLEMFDDQLRLDVLHDPRAIPAVPRTVVADRLVAFAQSHQLPSFSRRARLTDRPPSNLLIRSLVLPVLLLRGVRPQCRTTDGVAVLPRGERKSVERRRSLRLAEPARGDDVERAGDVVELAAVFVAVEVVGDALVASGRNEGADSHLGVEGLAARRVRSARRGGTEERTGGGRC